MSDRIYNVLFLCTGNSARSILGEALLNSLGPGRFKAYSAGSHPSGTVNPFALATLDDLGLPTTGLRSKSWDEFARPGAPKMDFVFTVCDNAAGEACPIWPGHPMTAHWGIEDPALAQGPEFKRRQAFEDAAKYLRNRITAFINLPISSIDQLSLGTRLRGIGRMDGATGKSGSAA